MDNNVTLILVDKTNKISVNVHKNIIASTCYYFENLLTKFKEKDQKERSKRNNNRSPKCPCYI